MSKFMFKTTIRLFLGFLFKLTDCCVICMVILAKRLKNNPCVFHNNKQYYINIKKICTLLHTVQIYSNSISAKCKRFKSAGLAYYWGPHTKYYNLECLYNAFESPPSPPCKRLGSPQCRALSTPPQTIYPF